MLTIEVLGLSNATDAFPSFYNSSKCGKLKKIVGKFDDVNEDDLINLLKSDYLSPEFHFDDIVEEISITDNILFALSESKFLKKIWHIQVNS